MKLAIMQPYLFPYIGYFSLIRNTDFFIFFDTPQYIRKGWINRNRILGIDNKSVYLCAPIEKAQRDTPIKDIKISYHFNWKERWAGQLSIYKKRAPYYKDVMQLIHDVIDQDHVFISELAIRSVVCTCAYLGICMEYDIYSKMDLKIGHVTAPDEWALQITKSMGYDTYVNPPGGKVFFDPQKYRYENIELQFLIQEISTYNQRIKEFVPNLSMIDVMMFCSPKEILKMMDSFVTESLY